MLSPLFRSRRQPSQQSRLRARNRRRSLFLENLEDRRVLATWYVNSAYVGAETGTLAQPFNTIQEGVNAAAASGDTVQVAAGTYSENVTISKSLTLAGAQAGVKATGSARAGGESLIQGTGGSSSFVVTVEADGVIIDGFEITPRINPLNSAQFARDGVNVRTANVAKPGDPTIGAYRSNVTIRNNWIHSNIGTLTGQQNAITLGESTANATQSVNAEIANVTIEDNYINVVNTATSGGPRGVILTNQFQGGSASIVYTNVTIDDNTIFASNIPLFLPQLRTRVVGSTITNNTLGNSRSGVSMTSLYSTTFSNNTIQDVSVGSGATLALVNSTASNNLFRRIAGGSTLVLAGGRSSDPIYFPASTNSTVSNNTFEYNDVALASGFTFAAGLNVQPNTDGSGTPITGTTGVDADTITLSGNTFSDKGFSAVIPRAAILQRSVNKTLNAVNGTPNTFNGIALSGGSSLSDRFAIADQVADNIDASNLGSISLQAGSRFVTPNSFFTPAPYSTTTPSIQRGIDAAATGDTVWVAAATYAESLNINRPGLTSLTLRGGTGTPGDVVIDPPSGDAITIAAPQNVTLQDLRVTGATNGILASNLASLTLANLAVDGNTSAGTLTNVTTINLDTNNNANTVRVNVDGADAIVPGQFSVDGQLQPISFSGATTLDVDTLGGDDVVKAAAHSTTVVDLDGGPHSSGDTLTYVSDGVNAFSTGPSSITTATKAVINYANFESFNVAGNLLIAGTGDNDILTVTATDSASGSYVLSTNSVPGPTVAFTGITTLSFSGLAGNDKLIINNPSGSLFGPTNGVSFDGGADLDALEILGGAGSSGSYTPGPAADAGSLTQVSGLVTQNVSFTGLEPIVHTTALTSFTVNGSGSGDVINVVDGPNLSGTQTVEINFNGAFEKIQLANKTTATVLAGVGSDTFNINYSAAPTGVSTLALNGETNASTFNVQASTPGALATNLVGGSSGDDFVFSDGAVLNGNANGNAGSDTLNLSANTSARTVTLSAAGGTDGFNGSGNSLTSFSNIDVLSGGSASDSLTQGLDTATSWNLSGSNAGNVQVAGPSRTLTFSSVENLTGANTASDSFLWGVGTGISGALNARGGNDNLNYSSYGASITVDLTAGTAGNIGGGIATDGVGSSIENLYGSSQADTLTGDADANLIRGNDGADTINAKGGTDDVDGNDGDDDIQVAGTEAEFDLMQGGLGNDQIYNVGGGTVTLNGFNSAFDSWDNSIEEYLGAGFGVSGNDSANGLHFGFTSLTNTNGVNSGVNNDSVTTSYNNGSLVAYDGDAGTDQITLVFTPTQLDALTTADILVVQDYVAAPTGKTLTVTNVVAKGNFTATHFETARLAVHDDGLILDITTCFSQVLTQDQIVTGGDATDDVINGTALVDLIFGQGGNDTINGLDAGDCLFGGAGNDVINGNAGGDMISGGSGNDTLNGQSDSDAIYGGLGDDTLTGDLGFDSLFGNAGNDSLDGGLNDDVLNGGAGTDTIAGGDGYDTIQVRTDEAEFDSMNGGNNTDTVLNISAAPVVINGFNAGTSAIEAWNGNSQPILGNSGPNVITFLITPTYSMTLTGVPYVDGADGNDHITGTFGADNLRGGSGNDTLLGLGGVDTLRGGADNDSLNGGDGVDYLYGDDGVDTITSGAGRDVIYFAGDLASEDVITDLALYSDTINLAAYGVTYANLSFAIVAPNTTINIAPSNKKIKLLNWTRVVPSSQFVFV